MKKAIALFTMTCLTLMLGVVGCGYNATPDTTPSPVVTPGISPAATNPAGQTGYRNTYPNAGMSTPMGGRTGLFNFGNTGLNVQDAQTIAQDLESLPGVQNAACAILGNTCLVGVEPANDTTTTDPNAIKNEVVQTCNQRNIDVDQVLVTTDPTLCRRIKALMGNTFGVGQTGLRDGQTGQNGMNVQEEFQSIMRDMGGTTGGTGGTTGGTRRSGTTGGTTGGRNTMR